jgi:hypothetical protein
MRTNVNEIRLSALLFDVTVAFTEGREPDAQDNGLTSQLVVVQTFPFAPLQQQTQQTVSRELCPGRRN